MSLTEPCTRCGGPADFEIASLWLCIDCYHIAGSTCAGIGRVSVEGSGATLSASAPASAPATGIDAAMDSADQVC